MDYFLLRNAREWEHPVNRGSYFARPKHVRLTSSDSFSAFLPIPHYSFLNSIVFPSSSDDCNVRNASVAVVAFLYVFNKRTATNPRIGLLTLSTFCIFGHRYLSTRCCNSRCKRLIDITNFDTSRQAVAKLLQAVVRYHKFRFPSASCCKLLQAVASCCKLLQAVDRYHKYFVAIFWVEIFACRFTF